MKKVTAIPAQVRGLVDSILAKAGNDNAYALNLARVPHLRGVGALGAGPPDGRVAVDVDFTGVVPRATRVIGRHVLLATGSKALRLEAISGLYEREDIDGHCRCFDSDSIKRLSYLPRDVAIVGGGIIAVEFARIFAELAADVTMVVRASDLPNSLSRVGIDRQIGYLLQAPRARGRGKVG